MKRVLRSMPGISMRKIIAGVLAAPLVSLGGTIQGSAQAEFKPPQIISAQDVTYPVQSIADGVVVVDVSIDDKGAITGTRVVRDIPSLTAAATDSIQTWKLVPAPKQGIPEASVLRVAVVFRPRSYLTAGPAFTPIPPKRGANQEDRANVAPGIVSATYPQYPINAANPGTV